MIATVPPPTTTAAYGWFVDLTPNDHAEFFHVAIGELKATTDAARDRMALLTIVLHEMGHAIGRDHDHDPSGSDLMDAELPAGVRRLPASVSEDTISVIFSDRSLFDDLLLGTRI